MRAAGPEEVDMKLPVTLRDETMMIQGSVGKLAASMSEELAAEASPRDAPFREARVISAGRSVKSSS